MRFTLTLAVCVLIVGGCSSMPKMDSFSINNPFSKKDDPPEPYPNPVKMAVTWIPDTLTTPGKTTTRGFGGRVFFYNDRSQAVPVEGELTVIGYEDVAEPGAPPRVRRFGFTKEQFTRHFSQSDLGASYSIWIPWDADGGFGRRITLVASFKPIDGNPIQGSPTAVLLPGPMPDEDFLRQAAQRVRQRPQSVPPNAQPHHVRQAGFQPPQQVASQPTLHSPAPFPAATTTTTTIPMHPASAPEQPPRRAPRL